MFLSLGLFLGAGAIAASVRPDPCAAISGNLFSTPADTLACLRSFPFNETLRQNVLSTVSKVFNFYTFEDYYPKFVPPFQTNINIRAELARINTTSYDVSSCGSHRHLRSQHVPQTDYDFNLDLYNFVNQLNDGHTREWDQLTTRLTTLITAVIVWLPYCYVNWQALLPAPVISLSIDGTENVYIAPDIVDFISLLPQGFTSFYESIGLDWQRLAGARVLQIEGMDPYDYVDWVADTVTGNYLDHGVRVNSVFTGYRLSGTSFSQRFGDLAGRVFNPIEDLTFRLLPAGASQPETVTVPFLDVFLGNSFSDQNS